MKCIFLGMLVWAGIGFIFEAVENVGELFKLRPRLRRRRR